MQRLHHRVRHVRERERRSADAGTGTGVDLRTATGLGIGVPFRTDTDVRIETVAITVVAITLAGDLDFRFAVDLAFVVVFDFAVTRARTRGLFGAGSLQLGERLRSRRENGFGGSQL